jgi:hypothetical protein
MRITSLQPLFIAVGPDEFIWKIVGCRNVEFRLDALYLGSIFWKWRVGGCLELGQESACLHVDICKWTEDSIATLINPTVPEVVPVFN